jgi:hypothetical protein
LALSKFWGGIRPIAMGEVFHSFFNIISNMSFDLHWACLKSYARPCTGIWLLAHLVIPCFCLPFDVFFFALWNRLSLFHPMVLGLTYCVCG